MTDDDRMTFDTWREALELALFAFHAADQKCRVVRVAPGEWDVEFP